MKKVILIALASFGLMTANARQAIETPPFDGNWSLGIDAGGTTTLQKHRSFFREMRGAVGVHLQKRLSPAFALGAEAAWGVNTSTWYGDHSSVMFDNSYIGIYGAVNLHTLFGGFLCEGRKFDIELTGGAGWGHDYANAGANQDGPKDFNFFATKLGMNFNFNVNEHITLSIKPSVAWNMTGGKHTDLGIEQTSAGYSRHLATFNILGGLTYNFGPTFKCADTGNRGEINALNAQINSLRNELDACIAATAANEARAAALAAELDACKNRKPEVVKQVTDNADAIRYVFFRFDSSRITSLQMPVVETIADYLKSHPKAKVVIKGYASPEGPIEVNKRLAEARANAVKEALTYRYGIAADRVQAEGNGIGDMFSENSWNRVSICTLED